MSKKHKLKREIELLETEKDDLFNALVHAYKEVDDLENELEYHVDIANICRNAYNEAIQGWQETSVAADAVLKFIELSSELNPFGEWVTLYPDTGCLEVLADTIYEEPEPEPENAWHNFLADVFGFPRLNIATSCVPCSDTSFLDAGDACNN